MTKKILTPSRMLRIGRRVVRRVHDMETLLDTPKSIVPKTDPLHDFMERVSASSFGSSIGTLMDPKDPGTLMDIGLTMLVSHLHPRARARNVAQGLVDGLMAGYMANLGKELGRPVVRHSDTDKVTPKGPPNHHGFSQPPTTCCCGALYVKASCGVQGPDGTWYCGDDCACYRLSKKATDQPMCKCGHHKYTHSGLRLDDLSLACEACSCKTFEKSDD